MMKLTTSSTRKTTKSTLAMDAARPARAPNPSTPARSASTANTRAQPSMSLSSNEKGRRDHRDALCLTWSLPARSGRSGGLFRSLAGMEEQGLADRRLHRFRLEGLGDQEGGLRA